MDDLPIALHDLGLGIDKIATQAGTIEGSRAMLRAFIRSVREPVGTTERAGELLRVKRWNWKPPRGGTSARGWLVSARKRSEAP